MMRRMNEKEYAELEQGVLDTTEWQFERALEFLNNTLGERYVRAHPEIIGAYMQTLSRNYGNIVGNEERLQVLELWYERLCVAITDAADFVVRRKYL